MAIQWPVQLQDKLNQSDFQYALGDSTIRSDVEIGLSKVRRRYTRAIDSIVGSIWLDRTEVSIFINFYNTTLNGGINIFEFKDPLSPTQELREYRFKSDTPPALRPVGGNTYSVTLVWEVIP